MEIIRIRITYLFPCILSSGNRLTISSKVSSYPGKGKRRNQILFCGEISRWLRIGIGTAADFNNLPALLLPGHRTFAGRGSPVDIAPASAAAPERRRCGDIVGEFCVVLCHSGCRQVQILFGQTDAHLIPLNRLCNNAAVHSAGAGLLAHVCIVLIRCRDTAVTAVQNINRVQNCFQLEYIGCAAYSNSLPLLHLICGACRVQADILAALDVSVFGAVDVEAIAVVVNIDEPIGFAIYNIHKSFLLCFLDLESRRYSRHSAAGLGTGGFLFLREAFALLTFYPKNRGDSYQVFEKFFKKKSSPNG